MPETRLTVPSLYGGISRQPASIRHPHQVEDALNAMFSVVDGASKRPGTHFDRVIAGLPDDIPLRMHPIDRDGVERHIVVYGKGVLRIFEIGGPEATVNIDPEALAYLNANDANADQLRFSSLADTTLIVNTSVRLQATRSEDYTIAKVHKNFNAMLSHTPIMGSKHRVEEHESSEHYEYAPDEDAKFAIMEMAEVSGDHGRPRGVYNQSGNNPGGFNIAFQSLNMDLTGVAWNESNKTLTKATAFDDYAWRENDQIYVTGGTDVTPGWYTISQRNSGNTVTLATAITSAPGDQTDITTDAIGKNYEVEVDLENHSFTEMQDIALAFESALRDAGAQDALVEWRPTPRTRRRGRFVITSPRRGDQAAIFPPTAPTDTGIYNYAQAGRAFGAVAVNTPGSGQPINDTQRPEDRWLPTAAPNQEDARLDATKMPVQLIRESFAGDGSTPAVFTVKLIEWTDRLTGGPKSNPVPSLWKNNRRISDIVLHRGRLVLAGDEHVVMSQSDDLFNFFVNIADNITESDPIDRTLGSSKVTLIDFITEFRQSLFITTKAGHQFELNAPEALTPETASFTVTTSYSTLPVRPVLMGSMVYFAARAGTSVNNLHTAGNGSAIYEYFFDEVRASNFASDITAHVQDMLPSEIHSMVSVPNSNSLFAIRRGENRIFHHRLHWAENRKEQSAWSIYQLSDRHRITDAVVIDQSVYLLSQIGTAWTLERLPAERALSQDGSPYPVHLDLQQVLRGTYNPATNTTVWQVPAGNPVKMMVLLDGFVVNAGGVLAVADSLIAWDSLTWDQWDAIEWNEWWGLPWDEQMSHIGPIQGILTPSPDGTTLEAEGDYSSSSLIAGTPFPWNIELTRPYYRDRNGFPDTDAWLNIMQVTTTHHESGPYRLRAVVSRRRPRNKPFRPPHGLIDRRGWLKAFWNGEADDMRVSIQDGGPMPVTITAIEYIADYEPRRG